ncbi:MAG: hypothetical protein Phog2KO_45030 [Phototrophicaceae bacterium]
MPKKKRKVSQGNSFIQGIVVGLNAFFALVTILCVSSIIAVTSISIWQLYQREQTQQYYSLNIVDTNVVLALCQNDAIPIRIANCSDNNLRLQFRQIREIANSYVDEGLTYTQVLELIGNYEVTCLLPDRQPLPNTFRCAYEFDVGYTLIFVFDNTTEQLLNIE